MSSKRQQTMAKMTREQRVKERRALKLEKKQAAREAKAAGETYPPPTDGEEAGIPADDQLEDASPAEVDSPVTSAE